MHARDIMSAPVVTAGPMSTVPELAKLMVNWRISAVPIVDQEKLVGIVSEGDLVRRAELGTERKPASWLQLLFGAIDVAQAYSQAHAQKASDIMTRDVVTAEPTASLAEIADLLETRHVKRIPIVSNGALVGIVSRSNIVQALATSKAKLEVPLDDLHIRKAVLEEFSRQPWAGASLLNVTVKDGIVDLWGITPTDAERKAIRIAAECQHGVKAVNDHMTNAPIIPWI